MPISSIDSSSAYSSLVSARQLREQPAIQKPLQKDTDSNATAMNSKETSVDDLMKELEGLLSNTTSPTVSTPNQSSSYRRTV